MPRCPFYCRSGAREVFGIALLCGVGRGRFLFSACVSATDGYASLDRRAKAADLTCNYHLFTGSLLLKKRLPPTVYHGGNSSMGVSELVSYLLTKSAHLVQISFRVCSHVNSGNDLLI